MKIPSSICIEKLRTQKVYEHVGCTNEYFNLKYRDRNRQLFSNQNETIEDTNFIDINNNSNNNNNNNNTKRFENKNENSKLEEYKFLNEIEILKDSKRSNDEISQFAIDQQHKMVSDEEESLEKTKAESKKTKFIAHDFSINNVFFSYSTLKYSLILLIILGLCAGFIFLFIIGVLHSKRNCTNEENIAIYLLVMGSCGLVRILIFFSCPYNYSRSILVKMYEHLIWRLVINRFKSAFYLAFQKFYSKRHLSKLEKNRGEFLSKIYCFLLFLFNFFCCNCCCVRTVYRKLRKTTHTDDNMETRMSPHDVCLAIYEENERKRTRQLKLDSITASSSLRESNNLSRLTPSEMCLLQNCQENEKFLLSKSFSNMSGLTLTNSSLQSHLLNEFDCNGAKFIALLRQKKTVHKMGSNENLMRLMKKSKTVTSFPIRSSKQTRKMKQFMPKSKSTSELQNDRYKRVKFKQNAEKTQNQKYTYGHRYFHGKHGNRYGTHKRLRSHHNRMQKPFRLLDFNSIRYCLAYLLQRLLDIFMISWFICGNYWVFNSTFNWSMNHMSNGFTINRSLTISHDITNSYIVFNRSRIDSFGNKTDYNISLKMENNSSKETQQLIISNQANHKNLSKIERTFVKKDDYKTASELLNSTILTFDKHSICYKTAFFQIMATYALLASIVSFVIFYRIYLVCRTKKQDPTYSNRPTSRLIKESHNKQYEKVSNKSKTSSTLTPTTTMTTTSTSNSSKSTYSTMT
jgi:hypothetical protein